MKIVISNLLLTRLCPLSCEDCKISKDYIGSPYPSIDSYKELSPDKWLEAIRILEERGCVFHTLYGGNPASYGQLDLLVKNLNENNEYYTFITAGIMKSKWLGLNRKYGLRSMSASVDVVSDEGDRLRKSSIGRNFLYEMKSKGVSDVVAVTVLDEKNIQNDMIFRMVDEFTDKGIVTEITLIDNPKSLWYDFAEETGLEIKSFDRFDFIMDRLKQMKLQGYLIHNNREYFEAMKSVIRVGFKCSKPWLSMTLEPDGTIRLCYRVGGKRVRKYKVFDLLDKEEEIEKAYLEDLNELCRKCLWNCQWMSEFLCDDKDYCEKVFRHNQ